MLASEGDLPAGELRETRAHLDACAHCRERLDDHQRVVRHYLLAQVERVNTLRARRLIPRLLAGFPGMYLRPIAVAFGAIVLAVFLAFRFGSGTQAVSADTLLERAVERQAPARLQAIRPVHVRAVRSGLPQPANSQIERRLATHGFDERGLLSARAFKTWRGGLAQKRDIVTPAKDTITLTTETGGELRAVSLVVRRFDFYPTEERFRFDDELELTVSEAEPVRLTASPSEPAPAAVRPPATRETAQAPAPAPLPATPEVDLSGTEVEIRWILHRVRADLGEDITAGIRDRRVEVKGVVETVARRREIEQALEPVPQVSVRLLAAEEAAPLELAAEPLTAAGASYPPLLAGWLEDRFPAVSERRSYTSHALQLSRELVSHAAALDRIERRYPAAALTQLSPESQTKVRSMSAEHARHLRSLSGELARHLAPAIGPDPSVSVETRRSLPPLAAAREVDRSLLLLFTDHTATGGERDAILKGLQIRLDQIRDVN
ncbi:MAG: hypothetical protein ACRD8O_19870 [Bryobacteraceae bacterium]